MFSAEEEERLRGLPEIGLDDLIQFFTLTARDHVFVETHRAQLVNELVEAADERRLARFVARYGRLDLLLIDEVGYVQLDTRGAELLFQVLTEGEESPPSGWPATFPPANGVASSLTPTSSPLSSTASPSTPTSSRRAPSPTATAPAAPGDEAAATTETSAPPPRPGRVRGSQGVGYRPLGRPTGTP